MVEPAKPDISEGDGRGGRGVEVEACAGAVVFDIGGEGGVVAGAKAVLAGASEEGDAGGVLEAEVIRREEVEVER